MNLFYAPQLFEDSAYCILDREESNHCLRAVRRTKGQSLHLTNGMGMLAEGVISGTDDGKCIVRIINKNHEPGRKWKLEMAVAPTKNHDRFEWFTEKACEIGIDTITPLVCRHSERTRVMHERLDRILIAAMKQSLSCFLPLLKEEADFAEVVSREYRGQKFMAYCDDNDAPNLKDLLLKATDVMILIGPEGDFTTEEVAFAKTYGFIPVSLGKNRLRTETAAIAACLAANLINA